MEKFLEKIKFTFKRNERNKDLTEEIYKAKIALEDAERSFNETIDEDYIDVAILNFNLAKKKYELCISEAKSAYKAS